MRAVKNSESFLRVDSKVGPPRNWSVEISTDASLGNLNEGVDSTSAMVVLVRNKEGYCAPLMWSSNKIDRVVHDSVAAEVLALVSGLC